MSQQFFEIEKGLSLGNTGFITGTGAPGSSGDSTTVAVGWYYIDDANGNLYLKTTAGSGTDKWKQMATKDYADSVAANLSWREPALVRDNTSYADITAAQTAANVADTVDGITIAATDRLLFTNLTSGNKNIYIVSGSSGAWIFTEDTNSATNGDAVYIESGTDAGKQYVFNGTAWVLINQSTLDELSYIRTFIGKSGTGSETPAYANENYITDGQDLETAISNLDGQVATNAGNISTNTTNIAKARTESTQTNVTTITTQDTVLVDTSAVVKWVVYVQGNLLADAAKKYVVEILATHDGHLVSGGADATTADYTTYAKLKIGTLAGLTITVDLNGVGGAQEMRLRVSSTDAVDVRAIREVINF